MSCIIAAALFLFNYLISSAAPLGAGIVFAAILDFQCCLFNRRHCFSCNFKNTMPDRKSSALVLINARKSNASPSIHSTAFENCSQLQCRAFVRRHCFIKCQKKQCRTFVPRHCFYLMHAKAMPHRLYAALLLKKAANYNAAPSIRSTAFEKSSQLQCRAFVWRHCFY